METTPFSPLFPFMSCAPPEPRPAWEHAWELPRLAWERRSKAKVTKPWQNSLYTSPYNEFCREQRPLLPAGIKNSDRERAMGHMWKELTQAERAAYKQGLTKLKNGGRGGLRAWTRDHEIGAPAQPGPVAATSLHCQPWAPVTATAIFPSTAVPVVAATVAAVRAETAAETATQTYTEAMEEAPELEAVVQRGAYQAFVTHGGQPSKNCFVRAQSTSRKAVLERLERQSSLEQLEATIPVEERATFFGGAHAVGMGWDPLLAHSMSLFLPRQGAISQQQRWVEAKTLTLAQKAKQLAEHHGPQPDQPREAGPKRLGRRCAVGEFNPAILERLESGLGHPRPAETTTVEGVTFRAQHGPPSAPPPEVPAQAAAPPPPDPQKGRVRAAYERKAACLYNNQAHQAAFTLLQHTSSNPVGFRRMEPPAHAASLLPRPAVVSAVPVAPQGGGGGGGGGTSKADPIDLETEEHGEGGHSDGELDGILQEQLCRLRSSWSHESSWHCSR